MPGPLPLSLQFQIIQSYREGSWPAHVPGTLGDRPGVSAALFGASEARPGLLFLALLSQHSSQPNLYSLDFKGADGMSQEATAPVHPLTRWLSKAPPAVFAAFAIATAFTTYFSMYSFRKPFSVGTFTGKVDLVILPLMDLKILFIISQVFGYMLSKFVGIKVISEMRSEYRAYALLLMIGVAHGSLLLFAITPAPYNAIWLFTNGIPLGMVWGLVFGFLEGRKLSELLGAGLSASYIVASGFVKTVGKAFIDAGYSEYWMPFMTGLVFLPVFVLCVWLLGKLPPPTAEDEALRTKRKPMHNEDRWAFFKAFAPGLVILTALYVFLTAYRDFRDNFAREIWRELGHNGAMIFTSTELPIAFGVLTVLGLLFLIKDNRIGMVAIHLVMITGSLMIGGSTMLHQAGMLSDFWWMVLIGLGLYLGYVPYGCVLFDRLIAAVGFMGTAGFMIYVTDAFGYLGSVSLMLYKTFGQPKLSWLSFFVKFTYVTSALCTICFAISLVYFYRVAKSTPNQTEHPPT